MDFSSTSVSNSGAASASEVDSAEVLTAGAKYVSGDITFAVGIVDGEAKDTTTFGDQGSTTDAYESMSAGSDPDLEKEFADLDVSSTDTELARMKAELEESKSK